MTARAETIPRALETRLREHPGLFPAVAPAGPRSVGKAVPVRASWRPARCLHRCRRAGEPPPAGGPAAAPCGASRNPNAILDFFLGLLRQVPGTHGLRFRNGFHDRKDGDDSARLGNSPAGASGPLPRRGAGRPALCRESGSGARQLAAGAAPASMAAAPGSEARASRRPWPGFGRPWRWAAPRRAFRNPSAIALRQGSASVRLQPSCCSYG